MLKSFLGDHPLVGLQVDPYLCWSPLLCSPNAFAVLTGEHFLCDSLVQEAPGQALNLCLGEHQTLKGWCSTSFERIILPKSYSTRVTQAQNKQFGSHQVLSWFLYSSLPSKRAINSRKLYILHNPFLSHTSHEYCSCWEISENSYLA